MTEKQYTYLNASRNKYIGSFFYNDIPLTNEEVVDLLNENEQLKKEKERYKRLSKIRQQQIDNRILTIKEFINNCSDNKVRSTLKELFYSEVNEYDLSLKYRELTDENEQLKSEIKDLNDILARYEEKGLKE